MLSREKEKHDNVMLLVKFCEEFGREPKQREEYKGVRIGKFLERIRRGDTKISEEDKEIIASLDTKYAKKSVKELVHEKVILLGEFYEEFGREPKQKEEYRGVQIGVFLSSIRTENTKISEKDIKFLENLGIKPTKITKKDKAHQKVILLIEFYEKFKRIPKTNEQYREVNIGKFLRNVRNGNMEISEEDKKLLKDLGIECNTTMVKSRTHKKVMLLVEFYEEFGREPKLKEQYKGINIGSFMVNVKSGNTEISESDKKLLEELGIRYYGKKVICERAHKIVMLLGEFYKEFGREPKFSEEYKKITIGRILNDIRKEKIRILEKDRKYLQDLGFKL